MILSVNCFLCTVSTQREDVSRPKQIMVLFNSTWQVKTDLLQKKKVSASWPGVIMIKEGIL